jgi:uncharacterized protein
MLSLIKRFRPDVETMGAAIAGIVFFSAIGLPASALSGAMVGVALLLVWGRHVRLHRWLCNCGMLISGVSMGCSVTPEMLQGFHRYPVSLVVFALSLAGTMVLTQIFLRRYAGLDRFTAFFASAPGALSSVLAVASETKADIVTVTMVQSFRLFMLVAVLPSFVAASGGSGVPQVTFVIGLTELLVILAGGGFAAVCLGRLGMAAPWIFGGMMVSAFAHGSGSIAGVVPGNLMQAGFALVGMYIGTRFSFITKQVFFKTLAFSFWTFLLGLSLAIFAALLTAWLTGISFGHALVAYAPGGLEAMIILGVALGLDPVYVGLHHLLRFFGIALLIPFAVGWLKRSE